MISTRFAGRYVPARSTALLALTLGIGLPGAASAQQSDMAGRDSVVRICAGGDVTLGTNLDTSWVHTARARLGYRVPALPPPDSLLAPLAPLVADADIVLLNVEGAIGEGRIHRRKCSPNSTACYAFRSPIAAAGALRRVSWDGEVIGNLANNHGNDDGAEGRAATQRHLRDAGVHVTGVDTLATTVATAAGDTVAFLGFAQWTGPDPRNLAAVRRHVARAAARGRRGVVTKHMGAEGRGRQHTVDAREIFLEEDRGNVVAFARTAVEAGADLVVGHGPHVMRAIEWRGDALVFYSLGNLVTYGPFTLTDPQNRGGLACAELDAEGRVLAAELRSTRQLPPGRVQADTTARAAVLADELGRADFPRTGARLDPITGRVLRPEGSGTVARPR